MFNRIIKFLPLAIGVIALSVWQIVKSCIADYECGIRTIVTDYLFSFIEPIYIFGLSFLIIGIVIVCLSGAIFRAWSKFAWIGVIISIIVIALFPVDDRGWLQMGLTRANAAWVMGGLFTITSLAVIAWKYWRLNGKK
jgi:hypothetical protein